MTADATTALRIIALLDGRPGHEKQTMGIIQAVQKKVPVQLTRIHVSGFSVFDKLIQTCRLYLPGTGLSHPQIRQADLLIGTGSRTHLPMLLYKKKYAIPAITCMTPASHLRNRFDLCFVPEHDGRTGGKNIMLTIGAPNQSRNKRVHRKECGLILLGGIDTKSHRWDSSQVVRMVERIIATDRQKAWTVSSSPRTPQDTVAMLKQLSKQYDNTHFFDYKDTPPGWIEEQYDKNKVVWVTADSISMIYEAITAGCSVGIFPMQWLSKNSKFKRNEDVLLAKSLVTPFGSWEKGHMSLDETRELNEAERCAERILQQWWPEKVV
ncbi:mitochondrial fission ELM1 family protein [Desulfocastanea catecholica]